MTNSQKKKMNIASGVQQLERKVTLLASESIEGMTVQLVLLRMHSMPLPGRLT